MYNIRNPEIEALLRKLGNRIGAKLPKNWGFTLLLFEYGDGKSLFYISSAERDDIIKMMKEFISRNEH